MVGGVHPEGSGLFCCGAEGLLGELKCRLVRGRRGGFRRGESWCWCSGSCGWVCRGCSGCWKGLVVAGFLGAWLLQAVGWL